MADFYDYDEVTAEAVRCRMRLTALLEATEQRHRHEQPAAAAAAAAATVSSSGVGHPTLHLRPLPRRSQLMRHFEATAEEEEEEATEEAKEAEKQEKEEKSLVQAFDPKAEADKEATTEVNGRQVSVPTF